MHPRIADFLAGVNRFVDFGKESGIEALPW
jgi:hypothetical protein